MLGVRNSELRGMIDEGHRPGVSAFVLSTPPCFFLVLFP
jgi:hypothetical protein